MNVPKLYETLADPETGRLSTVVPLDRLLVPGTVTMDGDSLRFTLERVASRKPPASLLERFLAIDSNPALLGFARSYGPLFPLGPFTAEETEQVERVKFWDHFRWELETLLNLAAAVRDGLDIEVDPYTVFAKKGVRLNAAVRFLSDAMQSHPVLWTERTALQKRVLANSLILTRTSKLVERAGIHPALIPRQTDKRMGLEIVFRDRLAGQHTSLMGALIVQFLAAVTSRGFATCSACGRVYVPRGRRPATGRRRYCAGCGHAAAVRDAKADYRARMKDKRAPSRGRKT